MTFSPRRLAQMLAHQGQTDGEKVLVNGGGFSVTAVLGETGGRDGVGEWQGWISVKVCWARQAGEMVLGIGTGNFRQSRPYGWVGKSGRMGRWL